MARPIDREKAIKLRLEGKSYSQIMKLLNVSKGTLSYWIADYPLSKSQLENLRLSNLRRVENFRNTFAKKRLGKLAYKYTQAREIVGILDKREIYLAGLFLYWGEGTKDTKGGLSLTNTNPAMLRFFIEWLKQRNIPIERIRILLQVYEDMNINDELLYWRRELNMPQSCFRNPYIKKSNIETFTYKGRFGHGTCTVSYHNRDLAEDVAMSLKYLMEMFDEKC